MRFHSVFLCAKSSLLIMKLEADEAITGTQVTKRESFQHMINDCMGGKSI